MCRARLVAPQTAPSITLLLAQETVHAAMTLPSRENSVHIVSVGADFRPCGRSHSVASPMTLLRFIASYRARFHN